MTMISIGYQLRREKRQFHPRHVIVMTLGVAAVLYTAALSSIVPAQVALPERKAAMPATETRAPEAPMPVQSLGYVVFDWSDADGTIPGFGPLTSDGQ